MIYSSKYSYIVLRVGLAAVFFWFGIDQFIHPVFWLHASVPPYIQGVLEILIGLSLLTGVFTRFFSLLGILYLIVVILMNGFYFLSVPSLGLIGGLLSIFLWPERR